eukprot:TRINITY_DN6699_c0_g1_i1.p1 TRINITY_DN6699_c0_g1~~TRINITY_DN6699_c0_g1_i1.p1  ORF type:complete len:184 (+),score=30.11 TRINITY_DN6699_c0_g1_i1:93-644(+)
MSRILRKWLFEPKKKEPPPLEIGGPKDFSHERHVGKTTTNKFEVKNISSDWKKLFQAAGIRRSELEDPETAEFIMETVESSIKALGTETSEATAQRSPLNLPARVQPLNSSFCATGSSSEKLRQRALASAPMPEKQDGLPFILFLPKLMKNKRTWRHQRLQRKKMKIKLFQKQKLWMISVYRA